MEAAGEQPIVLFLIDELDAWRGTETHLFRLLTTLQPGRLNAVVGVLGAAGLAGEFRAAGIRLHELGVPRIASLSGVRGALRVARVIRRERARLLLSYHTASDLLAPLLARAVGIPTISCRRDEGFTKRRRHVVLQRRLNRGVRGMISVSAAVARAVAETEGFPLERNRVIWNGEDLQLFSPGPASARGELGIGAGDCVVTCVSGLDPQKDHATLIRAFGLTLARHPEGRLLLVGEGALRERLGEYARPFGERVVFLGARRDVPAILRCSDLYAQTSITEGFSNSILQAMATGLPIVATRVGGNLEMVSDWCGFLVPPGDAAATAEALLRLIGDRDRRERFGRSSRLWAEENGSLERMADRYAEAFAETLDGRGFDARA